MAEPLTLAKGDQSTGIIIALDAPEIDACKHTVEVTQGIDGVVGYKLGMTTVLRLGLGETVRQFRSNTDKPLIYDHQKAGPDVFDMAGKFATLCEEAQVDGLILFPTAGPRSVEAFVGETLKRHMLPIVGGDLPFPDYNESGGGYIIDDALERIFDVALKLGADHFVVPGNTPEKLKFHSAWLRERISDPIFVVPGIGPLGGDIGDLVSNANGCRLFGVVGRAVYASGDPRAAATALIEQARRAYQ